MKPAFITPGSACRKQRPFGCKDKAGRREGGLGMSRASTGLLLPGLVPKRCRSSFKGNVTQISGCRVTNRDRPPMIQLSRLKWGTSLPRCHVHASSTVVLEDDFEFLNDIFFLFSFFNLVSLLTD